MFESSLLWNWCVTHQSLKKSGKTAFRNKQFIRKVKGSTTESEQFFNRKDEISSHPEDLLDFRDLMMFCVSHYHAKVMARHQPPEFMGSTPALSDWTLHHSQYTIGVHPLSCVRFMIPSNEHWNQNGVNSEI